ncbi:M23 family metallopeptidase [Variovorax sp. J22P168]|uniref:M23 family metallopeptidase n=1 Tax=Variovorax jilinensis TaxID=3053513 RepID=UPI0025769E65|nr:M23 family metallopeptidase [Variovorax sp. J22P168]MDM0015613.1 M23 family metallopeptidase [Variovorax sp. J22P168]
MKRSLWLAVSALCVLVACGGGGSSASRFALLGAPANAQSGNGPPAMQVTPVTMRVLNAPVPVKGSDGQMHLVYELELGNFTGGVVALQGLDVLDAASGSAVATLSAADIAQRLVVRDRAAVKGRLGASQVGLLYMHVKLADAAAIPATLAHRLTVDTGGTGASATVVEIAGRIAPAAATTLVLGSPLRGTRYIAGDGCCDSTRHVQATLPLNGQLYTAQRFAIDWEQLDAQGRIYVGDPRLPASYVIYGKPIYAVADGTVVAALDGLPDTPPGALPDSISIEQADGNHVVLDLGGGRFALFAHMVPGSVRVRAGDVVRAGQVLGQVGTSGNSSEPHLHFHVMDSPSPLASNGLPFLMQSFSASERGVSTAAYDQASSQGTPVALEPVAQPGPRQNAMPLDLWIVDLPS